MSEISWTSRRPQKLAKPLVIAVFDGEDDPARGGYLALEFMRESFNAVQIGEVDVEGYADYEETRPYISSDNGIDRYLEWPKIAIYKGRDRTTRRDIILISFAEPKVNWRSYALLAMRTIATFSPESIVFLAGQIVHSSHMFPTDVSVRSNSPQLMRQLGLMSDQYTGPSTIMGTIQVGLDNQGGSLAIMWSSVPHYLIQTPSPKAAQALLSKLTELFGLGLDPSELDSAVLEYEEAIAKIIESDDEVFNYLARLGVSEVDDQEGEPPQSSTADVALIASEMITEAESYLRHIRRDLDR